jgi:deoxycytidine triphosphate deaminase
MQYQQQQQQYPTNMYMPQHQQYVGVGGYHVPGMMQQQPTAIYPQQMYPQQQMMPQQQQQVPVFVPQQQQQQPPPHRYGGPRVPAPPVVQPAPVAPAPVRTVVRKPPTPKQASTPPAPEPNLPALVEKGQLAIKPFAPDLVFSHCCHLRLGNHFFRGNAECTTINPYDPEGLNHGFADIYHTAVEWSKVREALIFSGESAENIDAIFSTVSIAPDDLCIVINPLETIMGHSEETLALPSGAWPYVEALPAFSRCGIRISLAYTQYDCVCRPVLAITNTSRNAKVVLVAGRPIAMLALIDMPRKISATSNLPAKPDVTAKQFASHWHPSAILNTANQ